MMIFSVEVQIIQQSPLYFPNDIRVGISPSKKKIICFNESPLKMMRNPFYFKLLSVPNNRTCTIILFRPSFPSVPSLLGTVRLFFLDQISLLYVYFTLYDYLF